MILFDGNLAAAELEQTVSTQVAELTAQGIRIVIVAILFTEDAGSQLYTNLKQAAAGRVGIEYEVSAFSLKDDTARVVAAIDRANRNAVVTGVIVQKPNKRVWRQVTGRSDMEYQMWWQSVMNAVNPAKDVDGLHPSTIALVASGEWQQHHRVLPATCQAVMLVLEKAKQKLSRATLGKTLILGKSDLVGKPLFAVLEQMGEEVELVDSRTYLLRKEQGLWLRDAATIISATGKPGLISADAISADSILVDVGEPKPDMTPEAYQKAAFVSPSPGGVGPLTVIFLMRNAITLAKAQLEQ